MSKLHVKKGDNVVVIAGKDLKKTGEVLSVDQTNGRVIVRGVNIQSHHNKPKKQDDKGGIVKSEGAIDASNVQVICSACGKATRIARKEENGKSVRVCKKCGAVLDVVKASKTTKKTTKKPAEKTSKAK